MIDQIWSQFRTSPAACTALDPHGSPLARFDPHVDWITDCNTAARPRVSITIVKSGRPMAKRNTKNSKASPSPAVAAAPSGKASQNGSPADSTSQEVKKAPKASNSPWAKLITRLARNTIVKPRATRAYTEPRAMPAKSSWPKVLMRATRAVRRDRPG